MNTDDIPLTEQIAELRYELAMRKRVYPSLRSAKPETLAKHMARMEAALHSLQRLAAQEAEQQEPSLFPTDQEGVSHE